jgi:hypothetical protein
VKSECNESALLFTGISIPSLLSLKLFGKPCTTSRILIAKKGSTQQAVQSSELVSRYQVGMNVEVTYGHLAIVSLSNQFSVERVKRMGLQCMGADCTCHVNRASNCLANEALLFGFGAHVAGRPYMNDCRLML